MQSGFLKCHFSKESVQKEVDGKLSSIDVESSMFHKYHFKDGMNSTNLLLTKQFEIIKTFSFAPFKRELRQLSLFPTKQKNFLFSTTQMIKIVT